MSDLLLQTTFLTLMYEHLRHKHPVVDTPFLIYLPQFSQLSKKSRKHVDEFLSVLENTGDFYCDDYLDHNQTSNIDQVPSRLSNSLVLAFLFKNLEDNRLYKMMRSIWNPKLLFAFSTRIGHYIPIEKLFEKCINFLTKQLVLPVTSMMHDVGVGKCVIGRDNTIFNNNVFREFVESMRNFCIIDWTQKIGESPETVELDCFYKIYRDYMDESQEKRYIFYSTFKNIGYSYSSVSLLNFIQHISHYNIAKSALLERQLYELKKCGIYEFMEKLCNDDNKYARECFRSTLENNSVHGGDDGDDSVETNLKRIEICVTLFFENLIMSILINRPSTQEDDNNDDRTNNQLFDYAITSYHNLCAMFAIVYPEFHSSVKFQTMVLGCLLNHIISDIGRSIYTKKSVICRLVGKIDKYRYDPTKIDQKLIIYRKLLIDLTPPIEKEIIVIKNTDDKAEDDNKVSYPFKFIELDRTKPIGHKSYIQSKIATSYDQKELQKMWSMDLEDFCLYICNTPEFKVPKNILFEKYGSILLKSLVIQTQDEYHEVMSRFHNVIILMVQFTRRVNTTKYVFEDDTMKQKIDHHFNDILRLFLTEIGDAVTCNSNNICPHCLNSYATCLTPVITLNNFILFNDENLFALQRIGKILPKHDDNTIILEEEEDEKEEEEETKNDKKECDDNSTLSSLTTVTENVDDESPSKFEFSLKEGESYSFL